MTDARLGVLLGEEHASTHWYGISEEEKRKIVGNAFKVAEHGRAVEASTIDETSSKSSRDVDSNQAEEVQNCA